MMKRFFVILALICGLVSPAIPASMMLTGAGKSGPPLLLLDSLSASASVAYSTRKLRAAYAGNALTVQRASDLATQAIGFATNGIDLDTVTMLSFCSGTTCKVSFFFDQSLNANNQNSTTVGPTIVDTGGALETLNSHAAPLFGLTTNSSDNFSASVSQPDTIAMAVKQTTILTGALFTDGVASSPRQLIGNSGTTQYTIYAGTAVSTGGTPDLLSHDLIGIFNGASSSLTVDGVVAIAPGTNIGTNGMGAQLVGAANGGGGTVAADILMGDYIVFNLVLGSTDQATIRASFQAYWGTQ